MSSDRFATRRERLARKIRKTQIDALLVSNETNVRYLTGFSGDSSFLIVGQKTAVLVSDSRYTTQIAEECPGLDTMIRTSKQTTLQTVARAAKKEQLRTLGFESHATTVEQHQDLDDNLKTVELASCTAMVEELRAVKDSHEIAEIRQAIEQAERGFGVIRAALTPDMTEREIAHDLEHTMRRFGAERAAFHPIVAFDGRAALPHARPGDDRMHGSNLLLIDWGAETSAGYRSDLTRVLVTGRVSKKLVKVYEVVQTAQRLAIEAIRPGAELRDVDAIARGYIDESGFGKRFGHGLGHGIGLDIHENPRFSPISEGCLKAGMVVTVEPGVYLPGWGGVRIEDDVLVTRDGYEVLTSVPKQLDESIVS